MLFILNTSGVPSVAKIIQLTGSAPPPPAPPAAPSAPSNLTADAVSRSQINLTWTDNSTDETAFHIERCQGAGCTNFAEITTVGAGVISYQDKRLSGGTSYSYRVRAKNSGGFSGYSNIASATTPRR